MPAVNHNSYRPYPNRNSFCLGEWYWNQGVQKSKESFRKRLEIVGSTEYHPEDVRDTDWRAIDCALGGNSQEGYNAEWLDEDDNW